MKQVIVYEYISKINLLHFVKIPIQLFIICYETRWLKQAFGQLEKYAEMMRVDLPIPDTCVKSEFFFFVFWNLRRKNLLQFPKIHLFLATKHISKR